MKKTMGKNRATGFTIIEVMIVLAIAGLIMAIVFLAVPTLQSHTRDNARKAYARQLMAAIIEYQGISGKVPACDSELGGLACTPSIASAALNFIQNYIPDGNDPLTGDKYNGPASQIGNGQEAILTNTGSLRFAYDSESASYANHASVPPVGMIYIVAGHWCYNSQPDGLPASNPIASNPSGTDFHLNNFAILVGIEIGTYYCVDNY